MTMNFEPQFTTGPDPYGFAAETNTNKHANPKKPTLLCTDRYPCTKTLP